MFHYSLVIFMLFANCSAFPQHSHKKIKDFIVDVDAGIDDYQALAFLLNAEAHGKLRIAGIVLTDGNTNLKDVTVNVCRLLETVRRTDIPVYSGSFKPLLDKKEPDNFFGIDGFGDLGLKNSPKMDYIRKEIAPLAIAKMILKYPQRYNYIALAPLTNLALALRMYENVARDIGDIYIMGGNYGGEFNFLGDPESVHIVLSTIGRPAILFPFEACKNSNMTLKWRRSIDKFIRRNPVWNLNNMAESNAFSEIQDSDLYNSCDPILATIVTNFDEMVDGFSYNKAQIEMCNNGTEGFLRAELVVEGSTPDEANVKIIHAFRDQFYQPFYIRQFSTVCTYYRCSDRLTV